MTITATAEQAGLNVLTYLTADLDACGRNRRQTTDRPGPSTIPALERVPRRPAHLGPATPDQLTHTGHRHGAAATGHADRQHAHVPRHPQSPTRLGTTCTRTARAATTLDRQ